MNRLRRHPENWLLLPAALVFLAFFLYPIGRMLVLSFFAEGSLTVGRYATVLGDEYVGEVVIRTLRIGLLTAAIDLVLAYPFALYYVTASPGWRKLMLVVTLAPLMIGVVVRSFAWITVLGAQGIIAKSLGFLGLLEEGRPLRLLYNEPAIIAGLSYVFFPYLFLALIAILQRIDPNLGMAATSLGATPWKRFLRITLPLSVPGIINGSVIVFALSISAFATPQLLGGSRHAVMAGLVQREALVHFDWPQATVLSVYLLVASILLIQVSQPYLRRSEAHWK